MKKKIMGWVLAGTLVVGGGHVAAKEGGFYDYVKAWVESIVKEQVTAIGKESGEAFDNHINVVDRAVSPSVIKLEQHGTQQKDAEIKRMYKESYEYAKSRAAELDKEINSQAIPEIDRALKKETDAHIQRLNEYTDSLIKTILNEQATKYRGEGKG